MQRLEFAVMQRLEFAVSGCESDAPARLLHWRIGLAFPP
jgi:hypothetical protein